MRLCFHCSKELDAALRPGRGERCPKCGSDLKVCLNCKFYDPYAPRECREPVAEKAVEKDRANFCEHFEFGEKDGRKEGPDPLEALKALFKK